MLEEARKLAAERGGVCLSGEYENLRTPLVWRCCRGHVWKSRYGHVKYDGTWCKRCAPVVGSLEEMQELAKARGGLFLSQEFSGVAFKYEWQCAQGHRWKTDAHVVISGSWCSECQSGLGERYCRSVFEAIFGRPFLRTRPEWLTGRSGKRLELDGYCEELGIAFEHNGRQHTRKGGLFARTRTGLAEISKRDRRKAALCMKRGVRLMTIRELFSITNPDDLPRLVREWCTSVGIDTSGLNFDVVVDRYSPQIPRATRELNLLREIAKSKGGELVSDVYLSTSVKHTWKCAAGHVWDALPMHVKRGVWCRECWMASPERIAKARLSLKIARLRRAARRAT